jgi:hypothetical protein
MKTNFAILIVFFCMHFMAKCMEPEIIKPKLEGYYKNYLVTFGTTDAPDSMQHNLKAIQELYKKKNF